VVSALATTFKIVGFKPAESDGFLSAIKICSKLSFEAEVKPSAPCRKILLHIKNHFEV
jgi:hypothetical protein